MQPFRSFELFITNQTEERVNTATILKVTEKERERMLYKDK